LAISFVPQNSLVTKRPFEAAAEQDRYGDLFFAVARADRTLEYREMLGCVVTGEIGVSSFEGSPS
jgi:hypothetical protein